MNRATSRVGSPMVAWWMVVIGSDDELSCENRNAGFGATPPGSAVRRYRYAPGVTNKRPLCIVKKSLKEEYSIKLYFNSPSLTRTEY